MTERQAILVVGDVMLDRRVEGDMTRISPEAPAPVIRQKTCTQMPGGAANVAANLTALGRKTYLLGVVGDDQPGIELDYMLKTTYNVNTLLLRRPENRTIVKTKITANGQQVLRVDDEDEYVGGSVAAHTEDFKKAVNDILHENSDVRAVIISDYAKGTLTKELVEHVCLRAGQLSRPVFVDTKPEHAKWFTGQCYLIKLNLREALAVCSHVVAPQLAESNPPIDRAYAAAQYVSVGLACRAVVTCGADGAAFCGGQEGYFVSSVTPQEVYDVAGAGDTFLAVLVDSALTKFDWPGNMVRANTGAAEAVRHHGTTVVSRVQLEDAVKNRLGLLGKVMSRDDAARLAVRQRKAGKRIVMANGCFRFLHHGHWEMLRWAKQQGDVLIVAANDDESVKALRGDGVKFIPQEYRGEMLASIPFVDAVVFFNEESAEQVIRDIHPDILVKGAEYQGQQVPGADWLATKGGSVSFAPMTEGIHATDLAEGAC